MEKEKNTTPEEIEVTETEVTEVTEATETEVTEAAETEAAEVAETAETEAAETEVAEVTEVAKAVEPEATAAAVETDNAEAPPVKVSSKRIKKAERREAKAARKAANKIEEKKSRPNNALIAILIFGVVIAMFAFVLAYNYFSKPANIAKYIEKNGGEETYGNMQLDAYTTANITAEGNSMNIEIVVDGSDELIAEQAKEFYGGEDGEKYVKEIAAYFLTNTKPLTRAFSADVKATLSVGEEELQSVEMTYKEAKDFLEELEEEAQENTDEQADENADEQADEDADEGADAASEDAAEGE